MAVSVFGFIAELIIDIVGDAFDTRGRKRRVEDGRFFGGLRVLSGVQRGVSKYDIRTGFWRVEAGRMQLEEATIGGIELVPDTLRIASDEERLGFVRTEIAVHTIRTRNAELEWFVPTDIEDDAVAALLGLTFESETASDPSAPQTEESS